MKKIIAIFVIMVLSFSAFGMSAKTETRMHKVGKVMFSIALPIAIVSGGIALSSAIMSTVLWNLNYLGIFYLSGLYYTFVAFNAIFWPIFVVALPTAIVGYIFKKKFKSRSTKNDLPFHKKEGIAYSFYRTYSF